MRRIVSGVAVWAVVLALAAMGGCAGGGTGKAAPQIGAAGVSGAGGMCTADGHCDSGVGGPAAGSNHPPVLFGGDVRFQGGK